MRTASWLKEIGELLQDVEVNIATVRARARSKVGLFAVVVN